MFTFFEFLNWADMFCRLDFSAHLLGNLMSSIRSLFSCCCYGRHFASFISSHFRCGNWSSAVSASCNPAYLSQAILTTCRQNIHHGRHASCLLYTSDAAEE